MRAFPRETWAYLLNGHDDLNGVQAVQTEVVGEVGSAVNLQVERV
jgi:hypothetical protein